MITTNPIRVTSSMVTASSVAYPDTGENLWSSAVNYAAGATVSYSINGTFHRFESKQSGNLNHIPSAYPGDSTNAWWIDLGYVNKLAAFQLERNTQTITTSPYTVSVDPGERVGCLGIGNIEADSVNLKVYNSSAVLLYNKTNALLSRSVYDWYSWTYAPFQQLKNTLFNNLPINSGNTFELTFTKSSGSVKVGAIVPGMPLDIGRALMGNTGVRMINFSLFERDEFGASERCCQSQRHDRPVADRARAAALLRLLELLDRHRVLHHAGRELCAVDLAVGGGAGKLGLDQRLYN